MKPCIAVLCVAACCTLPSLANATEGDSPISANVALVSNFVDRGLTQTENDPAIQGGFDYEHATGFYAGVFGSNSSGDDHSVEIDAYLGWRFSLVQDFTLDLGAIHKAFPGPTPAGGYDPGTRRATTDEVYVAGGWKWISLTYNYALGDAYGVRDSKGSDYLELAFELPLGDSGVNLTGHAGKQWFRGGNAALWPAQSHCSNRCLSYNDYRIGVEKSWLGLDFGLEFTTTNARAAAVDGTPIHLDDGDDHWIVSVAKTF